MNENLDMKNRNDNETLYLNDIFNFLKEKIKNNNNNIFILKKRIANEIKIQIWVKDFISKSIRDFIYDIDDINKKIIHNDKLKENNKDLKILLKEKEKCLVFCIYFHDNCLKNNNKIKYIFKE